MSLIKFKRLLVPFDLSVCFTHSFKVAEDIAKKTGASITLLNMIEPGLVSEQDQPADDSVSFTRRALVFSKKEREMREFIRGSELPPGRFNVVITPGSYNNTIIELHKVDPFDLMIIPDFYNAGLSSPLADVRLPEITKRTKTPVLVVSQDVSSLSTKSIVLPIRNLKNQCGALPFIVPVARLLGAKINIVGITAFDSARSVRIIERKIALCQGYLKAHYPDFDVQRTHVKEALDQKSLNLIAFRNADLMVLAPYIRFFKIKFYFGKYFRASSGIRDN